MRTYVKNATTAHKMYNTVINTVISLVNLMTITQNSILIIWLGWVMLKMIYKSKA